MQTALAILAAVVVVRVLSSGLAVVLARVRQPPVMAEILAGVVIGATGLGVLGLDVRGALRDEGALEVLEQVGTAAGVLYIGRVAADVELGRVADARRAITAVGIAALVVPALAGAGLAQWLHAEHRGDDGGLAAFTLFLAAAAAVTAVPVLARIVTDRGIADSPAATVALGAAALQELAVWPMLALALVLAGDGGISVSTAVGFVAAAAGVVVLARYALAALPLSGIARRVALLAGLAAAAVLTDVAGLHVVLGAFLFGLALRPADRRRLGEIAGRRQISRASWLLLPLFFAVPALAVDLWSVGWAGAVTLAVVVLACTAAKVVSAGAAAWQAGMERREALEVSVLMNTRGLVELVVLGVGLSAGIIDARLFSILVAMALATTFATGPTLDRLHRPGPVPGRRPGRVVAARRRRFPGAFPG